MRHTIYFVLQICAVATLVATVALGLSWYWIALAAVAAVAMFIAAYQTVAVPLRTVQNGLYLLKEQDFSSKLRLVGQADADRVVTLFNDLMGTMKAERLKNIEQNDFLHKLIRASPMGIAICDYDGNVQETNPAFDAMINDELRVMLSSLKYGEVQVLRSGQSQIFRCTRSYFMELGFRRPFFLIERLTDEILKAETAIFSKIVRTLGHEVNNTLGSVKSVLQTFEDMHADDDFLLATLRSSVNSCDKLGRFVKGYADVVKLPEPVLSRTDINTFISEALPGLQHLAPSNVDVRLEAYHQPVYADIDTTLFERVLTNIVKNSVDSIVTREGAEATSSFRGTVTVSTAPHSIKITDNGVGIDPDNAQKLFTPFFSTKHADRGLGLMLIADVLRKHHADYSLTTDPATHLTTFTITL